MPSVTCKKEVIPSPIAGSSPTLGIIRCSAKYPGWRGQLYDESRYLYRGKVAESRFEKQCLAPAR